MTARLVLENDSGAQARGTSVSLLPGEWQCITLEAAAGSLSDETFDPTAVATLKIELSGGTSGGFRGSELVAYLDDVSF